MPVLYDKLLGKLVLHTHAPTVPGGSDTQVQFNDAGAFGGDSALTWDKTNDVLTITGRLNFSTTTITDNINIRGNGAFTDVMGRATA